MSREYPAYAIASVAAVAVRESEVLLVRRGAEPGRGLWSFPGGAVEPGETISEAVVRELYEEAGVTGAPVGVVHVDQVVVRDSAQRVKYHYVILYVLVVNVRGDPRPGGDAVDASWFSIEEALLLPLTRATRRVLTKIANRRYTLVPLP